MLENLSRSEREKLLAIVRTAFPRRRKSATVGPIRRVERSRALPLSFAQQRLWFLAQLEGLSRVYHISGGFRLAGTLDRGALRRALNRIVERHEALRTTFHLVDGEPVQRIAGIEKSNFALIEVDLREHADSERELARIALEEASEEFDLERGPLMRGRLIRLQNEDEDEGGGERHALLLTMHHIVSDGWSMGVMGEELSVLYGAYREGRPDPLPELGIQYADYAVWQREMVEGELLRRQAEYWKEVLAGAPAVLELPTDRPRPARQNYAGEMVEVVLDEELTAGLKALSQRQGATLYMALLAGWAAVLSRLSGQTDLVIGTPTANRGHLQVEGLIGFFVNTLSVRLDLRGRVTGEELLGRVKEQVVGAQANQDIPFEQVVELVQPPRSAAHSPVFQVMFGWETTPPAALTLSGLWVMPLRSAAGGAEAVAVGANFDLGLGLREQGGKIMGGLTYATALYERRTMERHAEYLRNLLQGLVEEPSAAVEQLPMLPAAEREQVLYGWNRTETEYARDRCIHELFEEQAERAPEAIAVVYEGTSLNYGELNQQANRLAHYLRGLGVKPGERVALCVERGTEMMVGLLGVLKSGGAYVPLDPEYPVERLRFMLEDSAPAVLLTQVALRTQGHLQGLFADQAFTFPVIDLEQTNRWENLPETNPDRMAGFRARHPAYVIYTSGSSGAPKGVVVEHQSVVNLLNWTQRAYPMSAEGAVLQNAPVGFDASVTGFFWPLVTGARVVMARPEGHKDAGYLCRTIRNHGVTAIGFPISMLPVFAEQMDSPFCTTLAHVMCGGEALPGWVVRQFQERLPHVALHNLYGPTEATVASTAWTCSGNAGSGNTDAELNIIPVGKPIANTRIYILGEAGEPAPVGVTGEIYIGGAGVARGYLNRPELTAELFVADPFAQEPGARMYKTGDLGRWLGDGNIEFLGRNDFQVKIRGFRIELGEIEARLREHAGMGEAVVVARQDDDEQGDKRLVAYYTVKKEVSVEALRAHLAAKLPEYMVPSGWVQLDALPLTPHGKLDLKALPAPAAQSFARGYEAPQRKLESQIAQIWAEILKLERVGRHDNFFELGGHSLLAVRMMSRLRQVSGREVEIRQLFAHPVLRDLAGALGGAARAEQEVIPRAERSGALPLSFAQQRMWLRSRLDGLGRAFHISGGFRLAGPLDRVPLRRSLNRIVQRHEVLRTTFHLVDGQPVQRIAPVKENNFALIEQDLRGHEDGEGELERIGSEEARAAFDLERGPLIRGRLIRLQTADEGDEERHALLLTMHHIVSDGWSMGVMGNELSALYGAYREGKEDPLPELGIQYADYAVWQRRRVEGELLARQAGYWKVALAGAPAVLELPADHPRPAQQSYAGGMVGLVLDKELTAGLKALSQRRGVTVYMTLLAGWAAVLSRLSGQTDVVIGTPTANRGHVQLEGLIGFFVNNLVVRVDLGGSPTGEELLERVKVATVGAQANQDIPFDQVVEMVQPVRSTEHSPVFQAMFAWESTPRTRLELAGVQVMPLRGDAHAAAKFDVALGLREQGGEIVGSLTYAAALYDRPTIERHAEYLRNLLRGLVGDDRAVVEQLPMLSAGEPLSTTCGSRNVIS